MAPRPAEVRAVLRKLRNARRETVRAVEKFAGIDPLPGHRKEAARLAREVKAAADEAVRVLSSGDSR